MFANICFNDKQNHTLRHIVGGGEMCAVKMKRIHSHSLAVSKVRFHFAWHPSQSDGPDHADDLTETITLYWHACESCKMCMSVSNSLVLL